ncbi:conserved hypothetical protein [Gammaproteobacteria bacterium]
MLKSYKAIYDRGSIRWLGESPDMDENGARLAKILRETDPSLLANLAEKFGDPVEWQREQRRDKR